MSNSTGSKEIPEDIRYWLDEMAEAYAGNIYSSPSPYDDDFDPVANQTVPYCEGALAMYHKLQEEKPKGMPDNLSALAQENERLKGERDEYARQQSIAFGEWIAESGNDMPRPLYEWENKDDFDRKGKYTATELYDLYIDHLTKTKNK